MPGASRDVELVIRARDEAAKAITSVADAFKILTGAQDDASASAGKTDTLLGQLGNALADLQRQAQGFQALGTVSKQIERAADAVTRLENVSKQAGDAAAALAAKQSELASAGARLNGALAQQRSALEAERAALKQSETEHANLTRQVERAANAYRTSYAAINKAKQPTDEMAAATRGHRDELIALNEQHGQSEKGLSAQSEKVAALTRDFGALNKEVVANNEAQTRVGRETESANQNYARTQETLAKVRAEFAGMQGAADQASQALGGVALKQDAIISASKATAQQIDQVTDAMKRQAQAPQGSTPLGPAAQATSNYRAQIQAVQNARQAWEAARTAATQLGRQMAETEQPTAELRAQFVLAKAASDDAQQAYFGQAAALSRLKGVTQGGFSAFHEMASALEADGRAADLAWKGLQRIPDIRPQVKPITASIMDLVRWLLKVPEASDEAGNSLRRSAGGGREAMSIMERLRGEVYGLATSYIGLYAAVDAVGKILKTLSGVQNAQARLGVVFEGDTARVGQEINWLRSEAERLGIPFNTLATEYSKVAIAAKEMGISNESARRVFISLAEAGRVVGMDASETSGMFRGLAESIDRGTLNARNFNMMIGMRLPGALHAMADALGVSVEKFEELQKSGGGVAASQATLERFAENLQRRYADELPAALHTLTAEFGRFQAVIQNQAAEIGQGGFTAALTKLLQDMENIGSSDAGAKGFLALGHALGLVVNGLELVVDNFGPLLKIGQAFVALKIASVMLNLASENGRLGASFKQAQGDVAAFTGALRGMNMQQMTALWSTFRAQVAETGAQIAALGADGAIGAAGTAIVDAALGLMNGIMVTVAATARAMWVAVGGFPGLILTAATFILGDLLSTWIGGLDQANTALGEHDALLQRVRDDYDKAADAADKLADKALKSSTTQLAADKQKLQQQLDSQRQVDVPLALVGVNDTQVRNQLADLIDRFKQGKLAATDFKAQLDAIARANPNLDKTIIAQLQDLSDKAHDTEIAIQKDDAWLAHIAGTATDAQNKLIGLTQAVQQVNAAFDPTNLNQYNDALSKLGKLTPQGKHDQAYLDAQSNAQQNLKTALTDPHLGLNLNDGQLSDLIANGLKPIAGATQQQMDLVKKAYDAYLQTMQQLAADEKHRQDAAMSQATGKSLDGFIQAYFREEGTGHNPRSSSAGFGQFTRGTWLGGQGRPGMFDQTFPDLASLSDDQKLAYRNNPEAAKKVAENFFSQIIAELGRAKIDPSYTNMFMGAFLGAPGAVRMIHANQTNPNGLATQYAGAAQVNANPNIFFRGGHRDQPRTVSDLISLMASKIGQPAPGKGSEQQYQSSGLTKQQEFDSQLAEFVKSIKDATAAIGQSARDAFIQSKVSEQEKRATEQGVAFSPQQRQQVTQSAGAQFDANETQREKQVVAELNIELERQLKGENSLTREEFIQQAAIKDKINLLDQEGQQYAVLQGKLYDLQKAEADFHNLVELGEQLKTLSGDLKNAFERGDTDDVAKIRQQMQQLRQELVQALPAAQAFAQALGNQEMIKQVQQLTNDLKTVKGELLTTDQVNADLAQGFTQAFKQSTDALGKFATGATNLKGLFKDVGNAFRQWAGDFLEKIAEMIVQQEALNLLQKSPIGGFISSAVNGIFGVGSGASSGAAGLATAGTTLNSAGLNLTNAATALIQAASTLGASSAGGGAGGIGGLIGSLFGAGGGGDSMAGAGDLASTMADMAHTGKVVGTAGGQTRSVWAGVFAGAQKLHVGGMPGLASDEYATILKRNEEVLTQDNPRHIFNQGGGVGGAAAPIVQPKIVNAFSYDEVLSHALNTTPGQQAFINFVRQNRRAVSSAMGS
jgi:tape measure domain-containing protein